jgi:hypothetical protein
VYNISNSVALQLGAFFKGKEEANPLPLNREGIFAGFQ